MTSIELQENQWACQKCTFHNSRHIAACEVCESVRPEAKYRPLSREEPSPSPPLRQKTNNGYKEDTRGRGIVENGTKNKPIMLDDAVVIAKGPSLSRLIDKHNGKHNKVLG